MNFVEWVKNFSSAIVNGISRRQKNLSFLIPAGDDGERAFCGGGCSGKAIDPARRKVKKRKAILSK
ncbi:MAG: hypothetical protein ABC537_03705 [Candidatus Methanosuratincola sp.]